MDLPNNGAGGLGQSAAGYENGRAGGRVGVADWESVSVHSDIGGSLGQDANQMHGLNSKLSRYIKFTSALETNNKELHEQVMEMRNTIQQLRNELESRPTSVRYDSLMAEREELHKRVRELMSEMQGLKAEKAAWTRDANRASMLEQELELLRTRQRDAEEQQAGSRDEIESLERALAAAMEGQRNAEDKLGDVLFANTMVRPDGMVVEIGRAHV